MNEQEVLDRAFAMPLTQPAYPRGPYRFVDREYFIVTYRTDPERLRAVVPAPLEFESPLVKYEFIRMPDSNGFGDYTESGQVIPVSFRGRKGNYTHCMFLDDHAPIAGGRELWGFPKKLGRPTLRTETRHVGGYARLRFGPGGDGNHGLQVPLDGPGQRQEPRSRRPTICSRSSRTSTVPRGSASWWSTSWRISR